jgi:heme A synthase
VDNLNPRPQIFNAQYGLFRCLLTTFALLCGLAVLLGLLNLISQTPAIQPFLIHAAIFACLTWLSYIRCQKRGDDFAKAIYDLFISGAAKAGA